MAKLSKACVLIQRILILLLLSNYGSLALNPMNMMQGDDLDIDETVKEDSYCFWHVMCELNLPLEIKKSAEVLLEETLDYATGKVKHKLAANIQAIATYENLMKDDIWVDVLQPAACNLTEEEKEELMQLCSGDLTEYASKTCHDKNKYAECDAFKKSTHLYQKMKLEMTEKGECYMKTLDSEV